MLCVLRARGCTLRVVPIDNNIINFSTYVWIKHLSQNSAAYQQYWNNAPIRFRLVTVALGFSDTVRMSKQNFYSLICRDFSLILLLCHVHVRVNTATYRKIELRNHLKIYTVLKFLSTLQFYPSCRKYETKLLPSLGLI